MNRKASFLLSFVLLQACSQMPQHFFCEQTPIACEWQKSPSDGMNAELPKEFVWWEKLCDPNLDSLMEKASCHNLDLQIAFSRLMQARLSLKGSEAALLPHVDASLSFASAAAHGIKKVLGIHSKKNFHATEIGVDAQWELDLFGRLRFETKAQKAQYEAALEAFRFVWVKLSAEVAKSYIELRQSQLRLSLLISNIESYQQAFQLSEGLFTSGFTSEIEKKNAEIEFLLLKAQKPLLEQTLYQAYTHLSTTVGEPFDLLKKSLEEGFLPNIPFEKPIGIPSELLRNRPDIRQAEKELAAATHQVSSAVAARFPRITLTGFIGNIAQFLSTGGFSWFAMPQLLMPVFNSKLIEQDIGYNKWKAHEAALTYQKTILEAFEEVENGLANFSCEMQRAASLSDIAQNYHMAYQTTNELYQQGFQSYLTVLKAQREYFSAEDTLIQSQATLLFNYINLYKALGGHWQ